MGDFYISGTITEGSYFVYKGIKYGKGTKILFTKDFYKRANEKVMYKTFNYIETINNQVLWGLHTKNHTYVKPNVYTGIVPERDISQICVPVWYYEPKELVKERFQDGTWFYHVWKETLCYVLCLLFTCYWKEWYLMWTIGLYWYLRFCYIKLSKGDLYHGR